MKLEVMFSSDSAEWETPDDLFERLHAEFGFTLDAAASDVNHKCDRYFTKEQDGLAQDWGKEVVWVNPPYGRETVKWVRKAVHAAVDGAVVVMLLPTRTDTAWWQDYVIGWAAEVRLLRGRLRFKGAEGSAPFPSAVVVFRAQKQVMVQNDAN